MRVPPDLAPKDLAVPDIPTFSNAVDAGDMDDSSQQPDHRVKAVKGSALAAFRSEVAREVTLPAINLSVPTRPDFGMRFDVNIASDMLVKWAKKAERGPKGKEEVDPRKFATMVILATHRGFLHRPEGAGVEEVPGSEWEVVVSDTTDRPLTFADEDLLDLLGAASPEAALRAWYGSDGHILQTAEDITAAAGYAEDDVNPLMAAQ